MGLFLGSPWSRPLIRPFIRCNKIDLSQVSSRTWSSFNAFFIRDLKPGARPFDPAPQAFISPCDGLFSALPITPEQTFTVKGREYALDALLENADLAQSFQGGLCLLFRLTPANYHHYCFPDSGVQGPAVNLPGRLHMVRPSALEAFPVLCVNSREYALLETDHFGPVVYMEVGAMMVGRIRNHFHGPRFEKGQEKGYFEFGGSTVILLTQVGRLTLQAPWTCDGTVYPVRMGQTVGRAGG